MAAGALGGKEGLAGGRVTDNRIGRRCVAARRGALPSALCLNAVDELGNRLDVVLAHRQRWHALFGAAAANDRKEEFSLLIVQHELGSKQVGTAKLAAAEVDAVTRAAGHRVQRFPALDQRWIARWSLLCREDGGSSAASLTAPAPLRRLGRWCLSGWRLRWWRRLLRAGVGDDYGGCRKRGGDESLSDRHSDGLGCRSLWIGYRCAAVDASRRRITPESIVLPSASIV
jgi:hypothetical protein